jgi:hypothetical protein
VSPTTKKEIASSVDALPLSEALDVAAPPADAERAAIAESRIKQRRLIIGNNFAASTSILHQLARKYT